MDLGQARKEIEEAISRKDLCMVVGNCFVELCIKMFLLQFPSLECAPIGSKAGARK